jgi:mono/diheme cytochrome c family protein
MARSSFFALVLAWAIVGLWIPSASAQSGTGLALVREHCAICHAIGKTGDSPHPGAPPLRNIGDSYDMDKFAELLQRGIGIAPHPDMPTFKVDRRAATAMTNYLRSIQK